MSEPKLVLLERFFDPGAAHIAKTFLEHKDIPAFLFDENMSTVDWRWQFAIGGIRLMVLNENYEEAKNLLSSIPPAQLQALPLSRRGKLGILFSIVLFFLFGLLPRPRKKQLDKLDD